ncbi:MAG: cell division protein FtsA [Candidatus Moraniibacteriota bacterium]|nr:MAG: cell division protein FtsA [Candidatus Moranbacteria bacterium]
MDLAMKKPLVISALDIGSSKVTCLIASRGEDDTSFRVVGVASIPSKGVRKSQIVDIEETIDAATSAVEMAERMACFGIKNAAVSISGIHIDSQNSKGLVAVQNPDGEITRADVARVVEAAKAVPLENAREILHVIPRYYLVDNQDGIKDPVGMSGVRLEAEAHLVTGSAVNTKNLGKVMSEIGLDTSAVTFSGYASAISTVTDTERELGVVVIDIGGGTTSVCVYVEGALTHSAVIPVGAKNITNDIAIGLRVSLDTAEAIKRNLEPDSTYTKVLDPKNPQSKKQADEIDLHKLGLKDAPRKISRKAVVEGIMRPRISELFELIKAQLIKASMGGKTPAGIVLTGGGALTYQIADAAKRILGMQARVATSIGLTGLIDEIATPEFATVTGLILLQAKQNDILDSSSSFSMPKFNLSIKNPFSGNKIIEFFKSFLP